MSYLRTEGRTALLLMNVKNVWDKNKNQRRIWDFPYNKKVHYIKLFIGNNLQWTKVGCLINMISE